MLTMATKKKQWFVVTTKQIFHVDFEVEATSKEDAIKRVASGSGIEVPESVQCIEMVEPETWSVYDNDMNEL
jgi:hypothetical protein